MYGTSGEIFKAEFVLTFQADPKSLDQRKEAKFVRFFEWPGPKVLLALAVVVHVVGCKGVVKMGDGGDIPRVAGQGAREQGGCVVDEVRENFLYKFLREPGDWG